MKGLLLAVTALACAACASESTSPAKPAVIVWQPIASWSGRGSMQTDTFNMETGEWRVQWETSHEVSPGTGVFQVIANSADSGTPVDVAVDHRGVGRDTAYVRDRPRRYYLTIESRNLDWKVTVEEPVVTY